MKKTLFLFIFLAAALLCAAQSTEIKPVNGKIVIQLGESDYMVEKDTTDSGVIVVKLIPTISYTDEINSKLGSIVGELNTNQFQIDFLQIANKDLRRQKKELEAILETLTPGVKSAAPAPESATTKKPAAPTTKPASTKKTAKQ